MKNRKLAAIFLFALLGIGTISGCKSTDNTETATSSAIFTAASSGVGTKVKQTLSNGLIIDADISIPKEINTKAVPISKVTAVQFSKEKALKILLQNTKVKTHQSQYDGATRGGNKTPIEIYTAENGSTINLDAGMGRISLDSPLADQISFAYFDSENSLAGKSNQSAYKKKNLSFMSAQQAVKKARDILTQLGIPSLSQPKIVALDHETLQKQEVDPQKYKIKPTDKLKKKGIWTTDDECYAISFRQTVNGIPVGDDWLFNDSNPPKIKMLLNKKGIVMLDVASYQLTDDKTETKPVVTVSQALKSFTKTYASVHLSSSVLLNNISLCYELELTNSNSDTYIFSPVWVFSMINKSNDKSGDFTTKAYVDAVTGKIIHT